MLKVLAVILVLFAITGCTMFDSDKIYPSSFSQAKYTPPAHFREVVVAFPCKGGDPAYLNLRIAMSAFIHGQMDNPDQRKLMSVCEVIERLEPVLMSEAVQTVVSHKGEVLTELDVVRKNIVQRTQRLFEHHFSKSGYADEYDVEIVVSHLDVTEGGGTFDLSGDDHRVIVVFPNPAGKPACLHLCIDLCKFIRDKAGYDNSDDLHSIRDMVSSLNPVIADAALQVVLSHKGNVLSDLDIIKKNIVHRAQEVFDKHFSKCKFAKRCDIDIVVTHLRIIEKVRGAGVLGPFTGMPMPLKRY